MIVEIDDRPEKDNSPWFFAIRLRPQTVKDVANLERPLLLNAADITYERIVQGDDIHYVLVFRRDDT